ncbi:MAG: mandelate racemase [Candidatus Dormibacteraeota bacterium]|nr:mandelate racemase [Candidatus Dormibacteraeota bacterium]
MEPALRSLSSSLYTVPTDRPEADGTLSWDHTTMLVVELEAEDGCRGMGFSYTSPGAKQVVDLTLQESLKGVNADDVGACWTRMVAAVRNIGRQGVAASAISAVDVALWDMRARRRDLPLFKVLPTFRDSVPVYGSGGFTTYSIDELKAQLGGWVSEGIPRVKMKIGLGLDRDIERILAVREAIGPAPELFIDANGAYSVKEAVALARRVERQTSYFEEPVSSDHLDQLAEVRSSIQQQVAAGEYGYDPWYFRDMLRAEAVDILQADATRCLGITGFLIASNLAYSHGRLFSAHTAPSIHAHAGCGVPQISHVEYFWDHLRMEQMLFEGVLIPQNGALLPAEDRPGLGLELKAAEAERYQGR